MSDDYVLLVGSFAAVIALIFSSPSSPYSQVTNPNTFNPNVSHSSSPRIHDDDDDDDDDDDEDGALTLNPNAQYYYHHHQLHTAWQQAPKLEISLIPYPHTCPLLHSVGYHTLHETPL